MKHLAAIAVTLGLMATARAEAVPGPVCGEPQVLAQLRDVLARAGEPLAMETGSVGQRPGGQPGLVSCAIRVHTPTYDTARFGAVPRDQVRVVVYTLELRRNAVFLRLLG